MKKEIQPSSGPDLSMLKAYKLVLTLKREYYTYESFARERGCSIRKAMFYINNLVSYLFMKPDLDTKERVFRLDFDEIRDFGGSVDTASRNPQPLKKNHPNLLRDRYFQALTLLGLDPRIVFQRVIKIHSYPCKSSFCYWRFVRNKWCLFDSKDVKGFFTLYEVEQDLPYMDSLPSTVIVEGQSLRLSKPLVTFISSDSPLYNLKPQLILDESVFEIKDESLSLKNPPQP